MLPAMTRAAPLVALAVAVVIWATTFVVSSRALAATSPAVLTVLRFALAAIVLVPLALRRNGLSRVFSTRTTAVLGLTRGRRVLRFAEPRAAPPRGPPPRCCRPSCRWRPRSGRRPPPRAAEPRHRRRTGDGHRRSGARRFRRRPIRPWRRSGGVRGT